MSIWDRPEIQPSEGNFVRFDNVGDSVTGRVTKIETKTFVEDGRTDVVPQITIITPAGEEQIITAGAVVMRKRLIEQRPEVGDDLRITFIGREGKVKLFTVEVKHGGPGGPVPNGFTPAAPAAAPPF